MSHAPLAAVSFLFGCALLPGYMPAIESAPLQDLGAVIAADEVSNLARMSKSNGALLQRESHQLAKVETSYGNDLECRVLILKSLIAEGIQGDSQPVGGMVFSVKEKYGSKSLYVDKDEVEGILAAMNYLGEKGLEVINGTILVVRHSHNKSTEIHYATRDGLTLGFFVNGGEPSHALKIGRTADWAVLSTAGAAQLKRNLEQASKALQLL